MPTADLVSPQASTTLTVKHTQVIVLSVLAACAYGVVHDQITVRICIEYFTIAHPPLFHTTSPTLLALCWGVAATAGMGAALGTVLALVSQSGGAIPHSVSHLARSLCVLLAVMSASAFAAAAAGYQLSRSGFIPLPTDLAQAIPSEQHDRFMAVWFAHGASYLVGLAGGALLCFQVWRARGRPSVISFLPESRAATVRASFLAAVAVFIVWSRFYAA